MRVHVRHETRYRYAAPAKYLIQRLRLEPRSHQGQHVRRWRIEIDQDCRLIESTDVFGNIVHGFTVTGSLDTLTISVEGEVETEDTHGVVQGTVERLPLALYQRATPLTEPDEGILAFARPFASEGDTLRRLHELLFALHGRMTFDVGRTDTGTAAAEAFGLGHGVCQDFAHVFIAAARGLGIPARYVGGYLVRADGVASGEAGHAWAEAHVDGLGWVGFDPSNGVSPTDSYVRVAVGLDYLGAAPVRGAQVGGHAEELSVRVHAQNMAVQQ